MPREDGRVVGVDVARFVALAGMMAVHILPRFDGDGLTTSQWLAGGRASALFAVLAGVSLSLISGRAAVRGQLGGVAAGVAVRAGLIAFVGLVLGSLHTNIAVILTYYGVLFLLGIPFLALRTGTVAVLAVAWLLLAPVGSHLVRPHLPDPSRASPSFVSLEEPGRLVSELLFTGYYPAFPWLAYLLAGIVVGRLDLRRWRVMATLGVAGAALVAAAYAVSDTLLARPGVRAELALGTGGSSTLLERDLAGGLGGTTPTNTWWWLVVRAPHSATPPDLAQTIGSALVVIAICLVLGRLAARPASVVFGAGAMTLSLYSLHVVLRQRGWWDGETMDVYVGQLVVVTAIGMLFARAGWRGPLEWFVGLLGRETRARLPARR